MLRKSSGVVAVSIGLLLSLLSVLYISCTKTGMAPQCNGVLCANGGYCDSGVCKCPTGYEGPTCATASVSKFINTYDVTQTLTGSDSAYEIGTVSKYQMIFHTSATPTTFFIDNFGGYPQYNDIVCTIDSISSWKFDLDTLHNFHQYYDHYHMNWGHGYINSGDSSVVIVCAVWRVNASVNHQTDTMLMQMKPHHF